MIYLMGLPQGRVLSVCQIIYLARQHAANARGLDRDGAGFVLVNSTGPIEGCLSSHLQQGCNHQSLANLFK